MYNLRKEWEILHGFCRNIMYSPDFSKYFKMRISSGSGRYFKRRKDVHKINIFNFENNLTKNVSSDGCAESITWCRDVLGLEEKCRKNAGSLEDVKSLMTMLKDIFEYRTRNVSSWIIQKKVKTLCRSYGCLSKHHKNEFIQILASDYAVNHNQVNKAAQALLEIENEPDLKIMRIHEQLRNLLTPQYSWLFLHIGKLENGVKFLVDMRTNVLDLIAEKNAEHGAPMELQQLNLILRELLSMWFSVGFLELERVTWKSSCEMLQKISEYEAVHPIRSWTDLKNRVGAYRRCFIYLHRSMPEEPLVVLHTALLDEISCSIKDIVTARSRMTDEESKSRKIYSVLEEDPKNIKAAVFYSISSTQRGLQGIELGNYLIKRVAEELRNDFPQMTQFSSLSPIPFFRAWLMERLKIADKAGQNDVLFQEEMEKLKDYFKSEKVFEELRRLMITNRWFENRELIRLLETPLMRLCARYLYLEKRRGYALDSIANFHLRNGAVMWRLNWNANTSPRGLSNSCGIMVNYRYFLEEAETKSTAYLERQTISVSEQIIQLAEEARKLF